MNNNAMWAVVALIAVIVGGIVVYLMMQGGMMGQPPAAGTPGNGAICTMEARQCPDGSYVGRTGPNCEFAACPGGVDVQVQ